MRIQWYQLNFLRSHSIINNRELLFYSVKMLICTEKMLFRISNLLRLFHICQKYKKYLVKICYI